MSNFSLELLEEKPIKQINEFGMRHYLTETGEKYPSVTSVLGQMSKSSIDAWRKRVGEKEANKISKESSGVGTKMHKMCEKYILGDFQESDNEMANQLFYQLKPKIDTLDTVYGLELPLYSDFLKLAGTADLVASRDDIVCVFDFKNSRKPKKEEWIWGYYYQGAAYSRMIFDLYGEAPKKIVIWIAVWNDEPQEFVIDTSIAYSKLLKVLKIWHPLWK